MSSVLDFVHTKDINIYFIYYIFYKKHNLYIKIKIGTKRSQQKPEYSILYTLLLFHLLLQLTWCNKK